MGVEIEKKFLIDKEKWNQLTLPKGKHIRQGYLVNEPQKNIRVRLTDTAGFLTIKGISVGASRPEFEYYIPKDEAKELLDNFTETEISKIRYDINYHGKLWEVDVFLDKNEGLIVAEIELNNENEPFDLPDWVGKEVTGDDKYYNSNLSVNPFKDWQKKVE